MATINFQVLQDRLFNRIHRTGEEVKNDFPNMLRLAIKEKAWMHFKNSKGEPFPGLGAWLVHSFPNGCSMPSTAVDRSAISYEDALQLCKADRELHGLLVKHRPSGSGPKGGRPNKETVNNINGLSQRHVGTSRAYIEQRLQASFPEIYEEYVAGKIKSARQAAIKAGFINDTNDPLMRLKANWKKATKKQRALFLRWVDEQEAVRAK